MFLCDLFGLLGGVIHLDSFHLIVCGKRTKQEKLIQYNSEILLILACVVLMSY